MICRSGVEDTAFESKDSKEIRGQGVKRSSRPRTQKKFVAKAKNQEHNFFKLWSEMFPLTVQM